jgi:phosphoglycerol geranylgeranyltransferase
MIKGVKAFVDVTLVVGGGIRTRDQAKTIADAGASIVVTGAITEKGGNLKEKISELVSGVKSK